MLAKNKFALLWTAVFCLSANALGSDVIKRNRPKMDHESVYYFLVKQFGPASQALLKKNFLMRPNLWGGPCDPYGQVFLTKKGQGVLVDEETECPDEGMSSKLDFYVERDTLAILILDKTCEKLGQDEETLRYFLQAKSISEINSESVTQAYQAFFPNTVPSAAWTQQAMGQKSWAPIVTGLCRTPTWQFL